METLDPANRRFKRGQGAELDPYGFTNSRSFDELCPAAALGEIVDLDEEVHFPAAPEQDLGVNWAAGRLPCFRALVDLGSPVRSEEDTRPQHSRLNRD